MAASLLAIDAGNTSTVFGLFEGTTLTEHWRIATERNKSGDELGALYRSFLDLARIDGICLSSTVPQLIRSYHEFAERYTDAELLEVGPGVKTGVPVRYDDPREAGPDCKRRRRRRAVRRPVHRRRLRHLDELRRRLRGLGIRRRRARPRDRGLDGRALRAGGSAAQDRLRRACERDR